MFSIGTAYGIVSDTHNHNWTAFSSTNDQGINTRLQTILDCFWDAARAVHAMGGRTIIHTGDLFHVRGAIAPSVLNPTKDMFDEIHKHLGVKFVILAGNHDLEGRHSTRLGNAVTSLAGNSVIVLSELTVTDEAVFIPWVESVEELKKLIELHATPTKDLFLHAPLDGVIKGLPDHGLSADFLKTVKAKRIFSGHYHNHKRIEGTNAWSVGATAHHTWSDVGTKAGAIIVNGQSVHHYESNAPKFVVVDDGGDIAQVDGNFAKVFVSSKSKLEEVQALRELLKEQGALGVVLHTMPEAKVKRVGGSASVAAGASLEVSVSEYIKKGDFRHIEAVTQQSLSILNTARAA